jgi:PTH1 family peptidyl-tRNA hydrolase
VIKKFKDFFTGYSASGPVEYIVAGLGNPGKQYEDTRHNAGFLAVDAMATELGFSMTKLKFTALCGDAMVAGKRVLFLKPSTYMNNSGEAVRDAMAFYKIPPENVIVISDDVALDVGALRIRRGGSDGGQKGLKSIIYLTGRDNFPRIRIGVGAKPHPEMELADWVLSKLSKKDRELIAGRFGDIQHAVELIVAGEIEKAMGLYNRSK